MSSIIESWRYAGMAVCASLLLLTAAGQAQAQTATTARKAAPAFESQVKARDILMRMADHLAGAQAYSVSLRSGYDAVQKSGQKIEFSETRKVTLSRPGKLRMEAERSDGAKRLTVFDGKEITLVDAASNAYATAPQPGNIDASVAHFVKDLGMRLPLSPLLLTRLPAEFKARVKSIDYVEKTNILGAPAHHLAARTNTVDFQVWVADGDKPVPLRVVITYRKAPGQPQFWAQFSDWNMAPALSETTFVAPIPPGARKVDFATQGARR